MKSNLIVKWTCRGFRTRSDYEELSIEREAGKQSEIQNPHTGRREWKITLYAILSLENQSINTTLESVLFFLFKKWTLDKNLKPVAYFTKWPTKTFLICMKRAVKSSIVVMILRQIRFIWGISWPLWLRWISWKGAIPSWCWSEVQPEWSAIQQGKLKPELSLDLKNSGIIKKQLPCKSVRFWKI